MSKYLKTIHGTDDETAYCGVDVDVYEVLEAFNVTCPAIQHAVKKLLFPGLRGDKNSVQDLIEARSSIDRAIQLETRRNWLKERNHETSSSDSSILRDRDDGARSTSVPAIFSGAVRKDRPASASNSRSVRGGQSSRSKSGR